MERQSLGKHCFRFFTCPLPQIDPLSRLINVGDCLLTSYLQNKGQGQLLGICGNQWEYYKTLYFRKFRE